LAAPSTGGAVTHTSSTSPFHADFARDARGWTLTVMEEPGDFTTTASEFAGQ
jgi:hypothetical protein